MNETNFVFINNATSPEFMYDRVDELNVRFRNRHFSDMLLEPNFNPIPIQTKYSHFQIINTRKSSNVPIHSEIHHNVSLNFNPSTRNAPPSGYFNNIEDEIYLRNQYVKMNHGNDKDVYVPSSTSDLYMNSINFNKVDINNSEFKNSPLFVQESKYTNIPPIASSIGKDTFFNHTRNQLRDLHT